MNQGADFTPRRFDVAVYLTDLAYGGPEEGGWYYETGIRVADAPMVGLKRTFDNKQMAYAYARDLNDGPVLERENEGRPNIQSVLSQGQYHAQVHTHPAPDVYPSARPHYE